MNFEAYRERKEKRTQLRLINEGDGGVRVDAVDESGAWLNHLLSFEPDGTILLCGGVDSAFGFCVTKPGGCIITKSDE